ncbi:hypothetical protein EDD86DRAFT_273084 [Gorgonomyces haynaldii]|nr:hypothetical protein EDD86DRAFT_273084 [Gorgonomyces haynaldii]
MSAGSGLIKAAAKIQVYFKVSLLKSCCGVACSGSLCQTYAANDRQCCTTLHVGDEFNRSVCAVLRQVSDGADCICCDCEGKDETSGERVLWSKMWPTYAKMWRDEPVSNAALIGEQFAVYRVTDWPIKNSPMHFLFAMNNPFALLADPEEKPQVKEQKTAPAEKKQVKDTRPKTQRVLKEQNGKQADGTPFLEAPEHKDKQVQKPKKNNRGREFDRKSAGIQYKGGDKKEVAGKGTWGDEKEAQLAEGEEAPKEDEEQQEEVKDPEEDYKTLDQFLQTVKKPVVEAPAVRKANEGADESQWKNVTLIEKTEDEVFFVGKKTQKKEVQKKEEKVKQTVEIDIKFAAPARESDRPRGRGRGRGAPRGRGGRGAQNNRGGKPKVNVADTQAFPTLGA